MRWWWEEEKTTDKENVIGGGGEDNMLGALCNIQSTLRREKNCCDESNTKAFTLRQQSLEFMARLIVEIKKQPKNIDVLK